MKYRIVKDTYRGYEVQIYTGNEWKECPDIRRGHSVNTFFTKWGAKKFAKWHAKNGSPMRNTVIVVKELGELP